MKRHVKRISIQTLGFFCLLLGVAGIILPVLNGTIFLLGGLILLSLYSPRAKHWLNRIGDQHPRIEQIVRRLEATVARVVGEV